MNIDLGIDTKEALLGAVIILATAFLVWQDGVTPEEFSAIVLAVMGYAFGRVVSNAALK